MEGLELGQFAFSWALSNMSKAGLVLLVKNRKTKFSILKTQFLFFGPNTQHVLKTWLK